MPVGAIPFPFGMCRICKDKATGIHYGVATCEGCKVFVLYCCYIQQVFAVDNCASSYDLSHDFENLKMKADD